MASKAVFGDASFFFGLAAKRDIVHEDATRTFSGLLRANRQIVTTDYVLDETLTLVKARTNPATALALLDRIESSRAIAVEFIHPERYESAKLFFRKHADHGYSFTDCTSFVVMRDLGITEALTTDRHFVEAGFKALLPGT
jgi:uncharacterized protein